MGLKSAWLWITGSIVSFFAFFKSIVLFSLRVRGQRATLLIELVRNEGKFFVFKEEFCDDNLPKEFHAIGFLRKMFFNINVQERMLTAGWQGTDSVIYITLFRWNVKKFKELLKVEEKSQPDSPVYMMQAWDCEKISTVKPIKNFCTSVYSTYDLINEEVERVVLGDADRAGIILYGPPGNGKTGLARYFAFKYKLPVYVLSLMTELDNHSIIRMFARVKGPAIVLMEDFDTFYDKRKCLLDNAKFTFDTILNSIDGAYSNDRQIIYIMTGNDISKFDFALKNRPSRFKVVVEVKNPDRDSKYEILFKNKTYLGWQAEALESILDGDYSLDVVLFVRESMDYGINVNTIINKLVPQFTMCEDDIRQEVIEKRHKKEKTPAEGESPKAVEVTAS